MNTNKNIELSCSTVNRICRACLIKCEDNELLGLMEEHNADHIKYSDFYSSYCDVLVQSDDGLPQNICRNCMNIILNFHTFKLKCKNSEQELLNLKTKTIVFSTSHSTGNNDLSDGNDQDIVDGDSSTGLNFVCESDDFGNYQKMEIIFIELEEEKANESDKKIIQIKAEKRKKRTVIKNSKDIKQNESEREYYCAFCDLKFKIRKDFIEHRKEFKHKKYFPSFSCRLCREKFDDKYALSNHLNFVHDTEKPYQCDICDIKFFWQRNKARHMKTHTEGKTFVCEICGKAFHQFYSLKSHIMQYHEEPRLCPHCGVLVKPLAYEYHISQHQEEQFDCNECGKGFSTRFFLRKHKLRHEESVVCRYCGVKIKKIVYKDHFIKHEGRFKCVHCTEVHPSKNALSQHLAMQHNEQKLEGFVCKICGENYATARTLSVHMLIHSGIKKYQCDVCFKTFAQQQNLKRHMRTHTGERPYSCPSCDKTFSNPANLTLHKRSHTGETPFVCDICSKGFANSSNMKKHRKIHNKNK